MRRLADFAANAAASCVIATEYLNAEAGVRMPEELAAQLLSQREVDGHRHLCRDGFAVYDGWLVVPVSNGVDRGVFENRDGSERPNADDRSCGIERYLRCE